MDEAKRVFCVVRYKDWSGVCGDELWGSMGMCWVGSKLAMGRWEKEEEKNFRGGPVFFLFNLCSCFLRCFYPDVFPLSLLHFELRVRITHCLG